MSAQVASRSVGNQRDYNHSTDSQYAALRKKADQAYNKRRELSQQSQQAFQRGDKAEAKRLSDEAKRVLAEADNYNGQAAEYVFMENNADSDENDIDLHGLYVREAEYILKQRIINGVMRHQDSLDCIVGKGLHSRNGVAKLKPAVERLCNAAGLQCEIDSDNTGIIIIYLAGAQIPESWSNINPNGMGAMVQNQNVPDRRKHGNSHKPHHQNQPVYDSVPGQANHITPYQQHQMQQQQQQESGCNLLLDIFKCFC